MIKANQIVTILFLLFVLACSGFSDYCLKGWEGTTEDVQRSYNKLAGEGFSPLRIIENGGGSYILLGVLPSLLDAKWYIMCFEERGLSGLSIQRCYESMGNMNAIPSDFYLFGNNLGKNRNVILDINRKEVTDFNNYRNAKKYPDCEMLVDNILNTAGQDDPIIGWAHLRKGYLCYRDARYDEATSHWLKVAKGEVPASLEAREDAMNRASRMYLKKGFSKNIIRFYRGMCELQEITQDIPLKVELQSQKAWIIMEAIRRPNTYGGGEQEDARKACKKVLELANYVEKQESRTPISELQYIKDHLEPYPFIDIKSRCALAELMYMESYAYEGRPEIAIELAKQLIEKYPDNLRERAMALIFIGVLEYQRQNLEEGYKWLEKVHHLGLDPKNQGPYSFGRIYPLRHSAMWLKTIATDMKRDDLVNYWDEYIKKYW